MMSDVQQEWCRQRNLELDAVTWENETKKQFIGDDFQSGSASMIRSFYPLVARLKADNNDPSVQKWCDWTIHWLALCLFSSNMNNFRESKHE